MKTFVLDTNVIITSPYSIYSFDEHNVVITDITLEELDRLKCGTGETGRNAREAIRILDALNENGQIVKGADLPGGGKLWIEHKYRNSHLPEGWETNSPDNIILKTCLGLQASIGKSCGEQIVLVSQDVNMRIKASILGITAETYLTEQVVSEENQYTGRVTLQLEPEKINAFYKDGGLIYDDSLPENCFVTLQDVFGSSQSALGVYRHGSIEGLRFANTNVYGVMAKNAGQRMAVEMLMRSVQEAPCVIIKGAAGTAKTFLSLACGLDQIIRKDPIYDKILVTRPNIKFDEDIGYLKGSEEEKIMPLIRPIYDNLEQLVKGAEGKKNKKYDDNMPYNRTELVENLFDTGIITAQAMAYMRGRSLVNTYLIVDEAQNLTPRQAFGIISRAGENTKVIMVGDPSQIDNPNLDNRTNGLVYASEHMKGSPLCWQMTYEESECVRSELAKNAVKLLTPKGEKFAGM